MTDKKLLRIIKLYESTLHFISTYPFVSLILSRITAEAICKQIYIKEGLEKGNKPADKMMLNDLLHQIFHQNKRLPQVILMHMETIQRFGNFGSHDQGDEYDSLTKSDIITCIEALKKVMHWYFHDYHKKGELLPSYEKNQAAPPLNMSIHCNLCDRIVQEKDTFKCNTCDTSGICIESCYEPTTQQCAKCSSKVKDQNVTLSQLLKNLGFDSNPFGANDAKKEKDLDGYFTHFLNNLASI